MRQHVSKAQSIRWRTVRDRSEGGGMRWDGDDTMDGVFIILTERECVCLVSSSGSSVAR